MKAYYYIILGFMVTGMASENLKGASRLKDLFLRIYSKAQQDIERIGNRIKDKRNPLTLVGNLTQYIDGEKIAPAHNNVVRLMTFNIPEVDAGKRNALVGSGSPWPKRRKYFVDIFNTFKPDIVGVQEANLDILNAITQGTGALSYKWVGKGESKSGYNAIFYNSKRLELLSHNTLGLNPEGIIGKKYPDNTEYARIYTYAIFKDKNTGKSFGVVNTHLIYGPGTATQQQAQFLAQKAQQLFTEKNIIGFFMGDLNIARSQTLAILVKEYGFVNTQGLAQKKLGPPFSYAGWSGERNTTFDYILYNQVGKLVVPQYVIVQRIDKGMPSDHRPVFIDALLS